MINGEISRENLLIVYSEASVALEGSMSGRVDPETASTHKDHWLHELPLYVEASLVREDVDGAKEMFDFWLDRITPEGRVPHMIVDTDDLRRKYIDGPLIQRAKKLENGAMATPHSGQPVLGLTAKMIAGKMPDQDRKLWVESILPKLEEIKEWQYQERDIYGDGLLVQRHPDETLFRHSAVTEEALDRLEEGTLSKLEERTRGNKVIQAIASTYRHLQGDDRMGDSNSTYNPADYMSLKTAAKLYSMFFAGKDIKLQDSAIAGMLIADNEAMESLYAVIDREPPKYLSDSFMNTKKNLAMLWDSNYGKFCSRLPENDELLVKETGIESYIALLGRSAVSPSQFRSSLFRLNLAVRNNDYPLATGDVRYKENASKIHRGAMHPSANFWVSSMLRSDNPEELKLKNSIARSVIKAYFNSDNFSNGERKFAEAYNSITGEPIGKNYWGQTAAANLILSTNTTII